MSFFSQVRGVDPRNPSRLRAISIMACYGGAYGREGPSPFAKGTLRIVPVETWVSSDEEGNVVGGSATDRVRRTVDRNLEPHFPDRLQVIREPLGKLLDGVHVE